MVCTRAQLFANYVNAGCRYSTGSNLNTYSALIHNFYSQEAAPHQVVHLAVNTGVVDGEKAGVKAYIGCVSI